MKPQSSVDEELSVEIDDVFAELSPAERSEAMASLLSQFGAYD